MRIKKAAQIPPEREGLLDKELGVTGLYYLGGQVFEEFLDALKGPRGKEIYREMADNDAVVGAILYAIEMLVRGVTWDVQPANDSKDALRIHEIVKYSIEHMRGRWTHVISEAFEMLVYGFALFEKVYESDAGDIYLNRLASRAQETIYQWDLDERGNLRGVRQISPTSGGTPYIPAWKLVHIRTKIRKNNPEGKSILRNAYRTWFLKKRVEEAEVIGIDRDLGGLPVFYVPPEWLMTQDREGAAIPNRNSAAVEELRQILRHIKRGEQEGLILPSIYDQNGNKMFWLELLSSPSRRTHDISAIVDRYDSRIAMSVLADFVLLGHAQTGSFALASSKTSLFANALGGWLTTIRDAIQEQVIEDLTILNGVDPENAPKLQFSDIEKLDMNETVDAITKAISGGALTPDETVENFIRQLFGLPSLAAKEA